MNISILSYYLRVFETISHLIRHDVFLLYIIFIIGEHKKRTTIFLM